MVQEMGCGQEGWRELEANLQRGQEEAAVTRSEAWLSRYVRVDREIQRLLQFRDHMQDLATRTTGSLSALPASGTGDDRSTAQARVMDINTRIDQMTGRLMNLWNEIWCVLGQIENQDVALILDDLFLAGKTMEWTAKKYGYSKRYLYKLRRYGLLEVDRIRQEEGRSRVGLHLEPPSP